VWILSLTKLGIKGLDDILNQIYRGSIILVAGNPGTGKTTIGAKFLYEGLRQFNENGLYLSFVETKKDFYRNMLNLGMNFESYEKDNRFKYIEAVTVTDINALIDLLQEVLNMIDKLNAKRLVVDSISAVMQMGDKDEGKIRELMHNFFYRGPKLKEVTTILIAELPYGKKSVGYGIEEFITDGVVILKSKIIKRKLIRLMEIRKMRGNEISVGEVPFIIVPDDAVVINIPESTRGMPSATNPESVIKLKFKYSDYKIEFPKGSQTLFVIHPSIDPLIISSSLGTSIIHAEKYKVIYRSYLHGEKTVKDRFEMCAKNLSLNNKEIGELISVASINPTKYSVDELYYIVNKLEENIKPNIVVVEGLETLYDLTSRESFINSQYNSLIKRMVNGITGYYFTRGTKENLLDIPLINFYDNIINVEPVITSEGRFVKIEPIRIVMKAAPFFEILVNADYIEKCINM